MMLLRLVMMVSGMSANGSPAVRATWLKMRTRTGSMPTVRRRVAGVIKDAPNLNTDGHLDGSEVGGLYRHYVGYLNRILAAAASTSPPR
jgi:hypothetical protein